MKWSGVRCSDWLIDREEEIKLKAWRGEVERRKIYIESEYKIQNARAEGEERRKESKEEHLRCEGEE